MTMLATAVEMAAEAGWSPSHADVTVVTESVRISPHKEGIRAGLASVLSVDIDAVSVKATTTDGMGFIGRREGVAAVAVVTMRPS
jgi:2-C-methyl-D-erythritol 2,4-cyclodiphosphate synthase